MLFQVWTSIRMGWTCTRTYIGCLFLGLFDNVVIWRHYVRMVWRKICDFLVIYSRSDFYVFITVTCFILILVSFWHTIFDWICGSKWRTLIFYVTNLIKIHFKGCYLSCVTQSRVTLGSCRREGKVHCHTFRRKFWDSYHMGSCRCHYRSSRVGLGLLHPRNIYYSHVIPLVILGC